MNNNKQFYIVDLSGITDRTSFHLRLQEALRLPSWYGKNLDALYDALTDNPEPVEIRFSGWEELREKDPDYFERFCRVIRDVKTQMPDFTATFVVPGNTDSEPRNTESASRNEASEPRNTESASGNTESDSGNTESESRNADSDSGNEASDSRNAAPESRNAESEPRNTESDSGNTESDSGNTASESRNAESESRNEAPEPQNTASDSRESSAFSVEEQTAPVPRSESVSVTAPRNRTLIITDIHGCYDECRALLEKMGFDEEKDTLVNLGDTIDRGPKIFETFEYLRGLKERMGSRCILIRGNHEQMMLDAVAEGGRSKDLWYYNSGEKTVFSFLHHKHRIQEFLDWYEAMPFYYVTETFNCVHASLTDPDPAANTKETLIWGRGTDYSGKIVMTGHTPYRVPLYFLESQYGKISEDVWTVLPETGMIALDTGCVYGNRLTGMVIRPDGTFIVTSVKSGVKKK